MRIPASDIETCLASNVLELILLPTEACNFRCTYCYEDFRLGRMEPAVVRGVKNLLTRRAPGLDALRLSWFGGEPLLALGLVEEILEHVRALRQGHPRLRLGSEMSTNAWYLTVPVFKRLLDGGVTGYQIAFDGPRDWHDRKRVLAGGGATFERVWANLTALRTVQREFEVVVRLHADRDNHAALPAFIDAFQLAFGSDSRFRLFIRPLSRLGGPGDDRLPVFEGEEGCQAVLVLSGRARQSGARPLEEKHPPICYAARANSFVVRADGRINKCTVALEHPLNQVGRIREDGSLDLSAPAVRGWMRGLWSGDAAELECPMRGFAESGGSAVPTVWRARVTTPALTGPRACA